MIQTIIHRLLKRRHFWRYASFSEVAELYASRTLRMLAVHIMAVFTSLYMYQSGYSLIFICFFWSGFYGLKILWSLPASRVISTYGPKHGTLIANIISASAVVLLLFIGHEEYGLYAIFGWSIMQGFSSTLYDLCYLVDFSKVKNMQHAGKEIAFMNILEKLARASSPAIGGIIAYFFGPQVVVVVSAILFLLSAAPLMATPEPVKTHRRLNFNGFPWRTTWRTFRAEAAIGIDVFTSGVGWSLFLIIVVFASTNQQNDIYAQLGFLSSVTLLVTILASHAFGQLIDNRRGRQLLRWSVTANSIVHAMRPLASTPYGAILTNIINEASTTGYSMSFIRGLFDTADRSGKRIEYLFIIEMVVNSGAALSAIMLGLFISAFADQSGFSLFFVFVGLMTLLIMTPRFSLYRR